MKKVLVGFLGLSLSVVALGIGTNGWAGEVTSTPVPTVIDERYEVLNDGTEIRDLKTTLIWQRCSVGTTWEDTRCTGPSKELTFNEAQAIANNGWRVPTKEELTTLIEKNPKGRQINQKAFPSSEGWFWTSDTPEMDSQVAFFINFFNGYTFAANKASANHVYLVRGNGVKYAN
ncbi:MAG: hypothetical protein RIR79_1127 [Pseudomonadota bacterium]|jgi:hypothetical protein